MLRTILRTTAAAAALTLAVAAPVQAQYGAPAPYIGSLSSSEIVVGGDWTSAGKSVDWEITNHESGLLQYQYTFTGFGRPAISHFILSLSDGCVDADVQAECATGAGISFDDAWSLSPSNPGFPTGASIYGLKIDTDAAGSDGLVFTFLSSRIPVYGDFYLKGGSDTYAYNTGLTDPENGAFIARPDTESVVPEPSTYALMGTGLLGLAGVAARRRRQG